MSSAVYLFGISLAGRVDAIPGPSVEGDAPIECVDLDGVAAIVSEVPVDAFTGPDAADRLADLSWVGPRACRHEEVVEAAMARSPVLPARFGTLFADRTSVARQVGARRGAILSFLEEMEGRSEWAVKGYVDREAGIEAVIEGGAFDAPPDSEGARYLWKKARRREAAEILDTQLAALSSRVDGSIGALCRSVHALGPLSAQASGRDMEVFYRRAALIDDTAAGRLRAAANAFDSSAGGTIFEVTGPWPPYHFCPDMRD